MKTIAKQNLELPGGYSISELLDDTPTPSNFDHLKKICRAHGGLLTIDIYFKLFSMQFGRVYGFEQEQGGATVQNLFPIRKFADDQISSSSKATLEMHTETAFHPWRAKTVCILCLRGDANAGTTYAELHEILALLDNETIEILHKNLFVTSIDQSFNNNETSPAMILTSVLFDNSTRMTYDRALMKGTTEPASQALQKFSNAIDKVKKAVYLTAGEILVINNDTVVHGRTPFEPRYDGTDRWLKRTMVHPGPFNPNESRVGADGLIVVTTNFSG